MERFYIDTNNNNNTSITIMRNSARFEHIKLIGRKHDATLNHGSWLFKPLERVGGRGRKPATDTATQLLSYGLSSNRSKGLSRRWANYGSLLLGE